MKEFEHLRIPIEIIKHATNNFNDRNFVAQGGFGKVYKGVFDHSKGQTEGAVKRLDRSIDQADASFWREVMFLSSYKHENIISLLGICYDNEERIIVCEYASNKSLDFCLRDPNLKWIQRLKICLGAACGLEYLHDHKDTQQRVLHRDIKSANILLDENWNAKIADFGLSKYGPANQQHTFIFSDAKGTIGYCDPMYVETGLLTKESDVYSFGVVLFEVLCSRHCVDLRYKDERRILPMLVKKCQKQQILHTIIDVRLRQQFDQHSFDMFVSLAYQCLERDRTHRPLMPSVVSKLKTALQYQEAFEVRAQEAQRKIRFLQNNIDELYQEPEASLKNVVVNPLLDYEKICPPGGSNLIILYTTTVKTIPKTFQDCSSLRLILNGFKVLYQERDVSMHVDFRDELWRIMGKKVALPRLFIKGSYIGGADEVLQLHEQGKFRPLLAGIPIKKLEGPCKGCAGNLFLVCPNCSGSKKMNSGGRRLPNSCMNCNENGLIKCPICF